MRHRNRVIRKGTWFSLTKSVHPRSGRTSYVITVTSWAPQTTQMASEIFNPNGNKGGLGATKFRFRSKKEAENLLLMAILKIGA